MERTFRARVVSVRFPLHCKVAEANQSGLKRLMQSGRKSASIVLIRVSFFQRSAETRDIKAVARIGVN